MDTKPLERFATWARRELINAVDAQTTAVLAVGSIARSERAEIVKKLESEIGRHGRQNLVDKVASTWFNRIIALRFMDARGYTDAGVVSPAQGQAHGQPEILSDAKRGNLDSDVVTNSHTANAIIGLLDGTRRSTDAEGEAYALLLTEYCRHWHKPMPFMFEREGDYTELLVPANLLADGAILARARHVLTEDVCVDVEVIGWLYQFYISERKDEVFAAFKKNKKAGAEEIPAATQLFTPHWIVRYLVENSLGRLWMLNRPTSLLVGKMDYYIAPVDEETDFLKLSRPEELTVIDPACGSGHMLTYAFDLLYAIYEEEGYAPAEIPALILTHNLVGTEIDPRAGALAAFALMMKARAKQRTFFSTNVEPEICVIEPISFSVEELDFLATEGGDRHAEESFWKQFAAADTFGSLIQPDHGLAVGLLVHLETLEAGGDILHQHTVELARRVLHQAMALSRRYAIVVANPPYMGSRNMTPVLSDFVKSNFPEGKQDLYGCFILRSVSLADGAGLVALVVGDTWMSIKAFEDLRSTVLLGHGISSFVHCADVSNHPDVFGANTAFVLDMAARPDLKASYFRLEPLGDEPKRAKFLQSIDDASEPWRFMAAASTFLQINGAPIAYWLPPHVLEAMVDSRGIGEKVSFPSSPHKTGDNGTYVRRWWELSTSDVGANVRWVPYAKGGGARRWYGLMNDVVDWSEAALRFYSSNPTSNLMKRDPMAGEGVTYSMLTSGTNTFRVLPAGAAFDMGGPGFFPTDLTNYQALAVVNSSMARTVLDALNPTLNLQVRDVKQIPVPDVGSESWMQLDALGSEAVRIATEDWNAHEGSHGFTGLPLVENGFGRVEVFLRSMLQANEAVTARLQSVEREIDSLIWTAAGVEEQQRGAEPKRAILFANSELVHGTGRTPAEYRSLCAAEAVESVISYAIGCMFGRYSLDEPGLILADQGATLQDYLARVPTPAFRPDADSVIPFVDDGWFEDDIVERFREFLRAAFGTENFEENLRFVEEALGVKSLRDYFITKAGKSKFYDDHVQRYKKRPIYWMFSSPKGSFNALIYMHRYTPSTVSTVLNEYLREYRAKLEVALSDAEQAAAGGGSAKDQKEADRLRKVLVELAEYEHDVLYPLATQQIVIDLDDGVKANYPKFYPALKSIAGLEAAE